MRGTLYQTSADRWLPAAALANAFVAALVLAAIGPTPEDDDAPPDPAAAPGARGGGGGNANGGRGVRSVKLRRTNAATPPTGARILRGKHNRTTQITCNL